MNEREKARQLLEYVPDCKISYVVAYLQEMTAGVEIPNETTLNSFAEGERMLSEGTGQRYTDTKDLFAELED